MTSLAVAGVVLGCVFGGALLGRCLRRLLPDHHLKDDTKDIVKLGIGLIATLAALVLGLLVSSAKESFSGVSSELTQVSAKALHLDRALARYGPEAAPVRARLRQTYEDAMQRLFSVDRAQRSALTAPQAIARVEDLQGAIRALVPRSEEQRELRSQALALAAEIAGLRWLLFLQHEGAVTWQLIAILVAWLTVNFTAFGLFGPANRTLLAALFLCALCVSGAIFIILELDHPFEGWVRVPDTAVRAALDQLGR